jgi:hypothetical protein
MQKKKEMEKENKEMEGNKIQAVYHLSHTQI